jgi:hypothetical protein
MIVLRYKIKKMSKLNQILNELENKLEKSEMTNPVVSAASVGWQIEHVLLTINMIVSALQNPRVSYKWSFKFPRLIVFTMNKIPRGRGKAPKVVQPKADFDLENIKKQFETARENIKLLETLDKNLFFEHPYFGHLKVKQTEKFLIIHSKHHLDIINDIIG